MKIETLSDKLNVEIEKGYVDNNEFQEYEALIFFEAGDKLK